MPYMGMQQIGTPPPGGGETGVVKPREDKGWWIDVWTMSDLPRKELIAML